MTAAYYQEPPEAQSIKSMFHIARILAIVFGILLLLAGLAYIALVSLAVSACAAVGVGYGGYCGAAAIYFLWWPILILIWGVFDIIIYIKMKSLEALVNARQYEQAKSQTLIWMILGFILGGILIGIILLIAFIKFDPLINAQRQGMGQAPPPGGYAPPPQSPYSAPMAAPPPMAPPPPAAVPSSAPLCSKCGKPTTYVAQYGRYYCYDDQLYV